MRIKTLLLVAVLTVTFLGATESVRAAWVGQQDQPQAGDPTLIYFFWGDGCPHCEAAKPFLDSLVNKYPGVELRSYEIWNNAQNRDFFTQVMAAHGAEPRFVPVIFIGDRMWEGYREELNSEIESALAACLEVGCPDAARDIALPVGGESTTGTGVPPLPLLVGIAVVTVGGVVGFFFFKARSKENQRRKRVVTKQNRRKNRDG